MKYILLSLLLISVASCTSSKRISVTGVASNAYGEPRSQIIADDGSEYYLKRKRGWLEDEIGKTVTIKGKLVEVLYEWPHPSSFHYNPQKKVFVRYRYKFAK